MKMVRLVVWGVCGLMGLTMGCRKSSDDPEKVLDYQSGSLSWVVSDDTLRTWMADSMDHTLQVVDGSYRLSLRGQSAMRRIEAAVTFPYSRYGVIPETTFTIRGENPFFTAYGTYRNDTLVYQSHAVYDSGYVSITRANTGEQKISGSFVFSVRDTLGGRYTIRSGTFSDVTYRIP